MPSAEKHKELRQSYIKHGNRMEFLLRMGNPGNLEKINDPMVGIQDILRTGQQFLTADDESFCRCSLYIEVGSNISR